MTGTSTDTAPAAPVFSAQLGQQFWDFVDLVLKGRMARALEQHAPLYPYYRNVRFAARVDLDALYDALAGLAGFRVHRLDASRIILDGDDAFVAGSGTRKASYCACYFAVWARTQALAEAARAAVLACVGEARIREPMFSIDWHFLTGKGELQSANIEEMADDVLHDEAYPELGTSVAAFIAAYLDAPETVLVLQGPPGTGKTRLIRGILGEMSRRRDGEASALYTGDKRALENDEIYVKFITGWEDAFVVEDADHLLKPRAAGNEHLHRFLAIADGVVRAQGRKIIFSTNLPNLGDLDDALVRPGRCFARVTMRELTLEESERLLARLATGQAARLDRAARQLRAAGARSHSVAEVYQAFGRA